MTDQEKTDLIETPHLLEYLIEQCETKCVAQCCGLDAFNFSPLNIAFFFTVNERKPECITKENVRQVKKELVDLQKNCEALKENEYGDIGFLKAIKRPINRNELEDMCKEIAYNIDLPRDLVLGMQIKRYKTK